MTTAFLTLFSLWVRGTNTTPLACGRICISQTERYVDLGLQSNVKNNSSGQEMKCNDNSVMQCDSCYSGWRYRMASKFQRDWRKRIIRKSLWIVPIGICDGTPSISSDLLTQHFWCLNTFAIMRAFAISRFYSLVFLSRGIFLLHWSLACFWPVFSLPKSPSSPQWECTRALMCRCVDSP